MISVKIASIIAVAAFAAGSIFASPIPQAIAAVIATDVQCTGCVGTPDLAGNAVTAVKIKDGEVKAAEIATNAVGASEIAADAVGGSELAGVTKLLFGECTVDAEESSRVIGQGGILGISCPVNGVAVGDNAMASMNAGNSCFSATKAFAGTDTVFVYLKNACSINQTIGSAGAVSVIAYN